MHENGQRLKTSQFRKDSSGNEFLVDTAEIEYYSFLQAGGHVTTANDSITIQVSVSKSCLNTSQVVWGGLAGLVGTYNAKKKSPPRAVFVATKTRCMLEGIYLCRLGSMTA